MSHAACTLPISLSAVVAIVALSQRRFGQLDNFRYERASWRNEKTFASTKRVDEDDDDAAAFPAKRVGHKACQAGTISCPN